MILFLGEVDHANLGTEVAAAINVVAPGTARSWVQQAHRLKYATRDVVTYSTPHALRALAPQITWAICMDSRHEVFKSMLNRMRLRGRHWVKKPGEGALRPVRLGMMHGGSTFRGGPKECLRADAELGIEATFVSPDSFRFIPRDARTTYPLCNSYGVNLTPPETLTRCEGPVRVGHSPTSRYKGSAEVSTALRSLPGATLNGITKVAHPTCLAQKATCHAFVDQMVKDVGGYGQSTVEALAFGCATFASIHHVSPRCWEHFPRPPLTHALTANGLAKALRPYIEDRDRLHALREQSLQWAKDHASPRAVGTYWLARLPSWTQEQTPIHTAGG